MPSLFTHINFIEQEIKEDPNLEKLDAPSLKLGSIFPDIISYDPFLKIKLFSYMHYNYDLAISFGKELLRNSRNIKEVSFSIGFLSHAILDKEVHAYLEHTKGIDYKDHFISEMYLDAKYKTSNYPKASFPNELFKITIQKKFKNYSCDINRLKKYHLWIYNISFNAHKSFIIKNFKQNSKENKNKLFSFIFENQKYHGQKIKNILKNTKVNQEIIKKIIEKIEKGKINFKNEMNTYFKKNPIV